jgi:predicted nucleic acid-binding protein
MTLFVESSALLKRYIDEPGTTTVVDAMQSDPEWIASALAHTEVALTMCHLALTEEQATNARHRLDEDWHRFRILPADSTCLLRAAEIGCAQRIRTLDAIHLAAADKLPRRLTFLTFDQRLATAARALGIDVGGARVPSPAAPALEMEE